MSTLSKTAFEAKYTDNTTGRFADNTSQAIGADDMREFADDIADSFTVSGGLSYTIVQIGDWNMDSTNEVLVNHGVTDYTTIVSVDCIIRGDALSHYKLTRGPDATTTGVLQGWIDYIISDEILLRRLDGGFFDSTSFDSTSFNRGWIVIGYLG